MTTGRSSLSCDMSRFDPVPTKDSMLTGFLALGAKSSPFVLETSAKLWESFY